MATADGFDCQLAGVDLLLRPGSYRKRNAPTFGARFASGDPSYTDLSFWQHHPQASWVGGMDAPVWSDKAMYSKGVGLDTTSKEGVRVGRGLTGVALPTGAVVGMPLRFVSTPAGLFAWQGQGSGPTYSTLIWKLDTSVTPYSASSWVRKDNVKTRQYAGAGLSPFRAAYAVYFMGQILFVGAHNSSPSEYSNAWLFDPNTYQWGVFCNGGSTYVGYKKGGVCGQPVALGNYVYCPGGVRGSTVEAFSGTGYGPTDAGTYGGAYRSGWAAWDWAAADEVVCGEVDGGYLWMMSSNGRIARCDGNTFTEYWRFDAGVQGTAMRSFDGKLLVGTYEWVDSSTHGQAVIYQLSGSSLTQLRRWGDPTKANVIGQFGVYDRRIFYSAGGLFGFADGIGVAVYDPVEDAHSIFATNRDTATYPDASGTGVDWIVDAITFFNGYMFVNVRGYGIFRSSVRYQDHAAGSAEYDVSGMGVGLGSKHGGWFEGSDFDAGTPGLDKLWRYLVVTADVPTGSCSLFVEHSVDGGVTWATSGTVEGTSVAMWHTATVYGVGDYVRPVVLNGHLYRCTASTTTHLSHATTEPTWPTGSGATVTDGALTWTEVNGAYDGWAGSASRLTVVFSLPNPTIGPRLQYRVSLRTTVATVTPTLLSVVASYLPVPEPNWQWEMYAVLSEKQELSDGTVVERDAQAELAQLEAVFRGGGGFTDFYDLDGQKWAVLINDFYEDVATTRSPFEAGIRLVLVEGNTSA